MATSYQEFLAKKKKEELAAKESTAEAQASLDITVDAFNRKKRKKSKRPFSQETLVKRLQRK
jgi:hypothetical protein